ncbi:hypothetical protein [Bradyrhizobium sp. Ai1a-2]|uniref:hypothetical protein n=1 Tax=Bradyrhizobium sp. Ai1a-2 TaxID=196490 RepID=UPI00040AD8D8|nr:hypothetical protein [Bradyrhizobium sp. Ai1a-2]
MITLKTDTMKRCGTCARACYRQDGMIACGAPVDQDAIMGRGGVNPIWAERKYNLDRIGGLVTALSRAQKGLPPDLQSDAKLAREPEGSDAECMHPNDGNTCRMWQQHPDLAGDDEDWRDCTMLGSQYEEQISTSGKRRHRPLRLDMVGVRDRFGDERGIGDWRPGAGPGSAI